MKILVLSCGTGQGHNSAAAAVREAFLRHGHDCVIADPLQFGRKHTAGVVAATYNGIIKNAPGAFGAIYKAGDLYSATGLTSPIYFANTLYAKHLRGYIEENGFSAVVCTHLFAMEALTALKKRRADFAVPCYGVLTDYTCIPFLAETHLTGYFIPSEELKAELAGRGMEKELLFGTGIPVAHRFEEPMEKTAAREALMLPQDVPTVLVMSGGVGCGHLDALCRALTERATRPFVACVLTGRNEKLKAELDAAFCDNDCVRTVAFTDKANVYMRAADVMITKPGGLTSTEAAVANVPLVHLLAFSGCETKNAAFFAAHGMAEKADDVETAADKAWELIENKDSAADMCAMQRRFIPAGAADRIVALVTEAGA